MPDEVKHSPTMILTVQAAYAEEIKGELKEAVNSLPSEEFAAWALVNLSPYTSADILAEADLTEVQRNIKEHFGGISG
jgi:hypothetical protein